MEQHRIGTDPTDLYLSDMVPDIGYTISTPNKCNRTNTLKILARANAHIFVCIFQQISPGLHLGSKQNQLKKAA